MYSFTIRLNELLDSLNAANSKLAEIIGCDRSNISRLRGGSRVLRRDGVASMRLVNGICNYAAEAGKLETLCEKIGSEHVSSPQLIKDQLLKWLFEGMEYRGSGSFTGSDAVPFHSFGEKLTAVMNLTELSSIKLSRQLNMDPSNISRFRSGQRTPKSNPRIVDAICGVLLDRAADQGMLTAMSRLTGIPVDILADDKEGIRYFRGWLCDFDTEDSGIVIEKLIDRIDSFTPYNTVTMANLAEIAPDEVINSTNTAYYGTTGLREAVIRLLGRAAKNGGSELWLYSDQSMNWMTGDRCFFRKWSSLMELCVSNGVKITIIHNLDRELREMMDAVTGWMPMYISGAVNPYYCVKQRDNRFSHSIFLVPDAECIESSNTIGTEHLGCYRYHTDQRSMSIYRSQFESLLQHSKPLMKISRQNDPAEQFSAAADVTAVNKTLSLATMPLPVLTSILNRYGVDGEVRQKITNEWITHQTMLNESLNAGQYRELFSLPKKESVREGKAKADVPYLDAYYTAEEYAQHIAALCELMENRESCNLILLAEPQFVNTRLLITGNSVNLTRTSEPRISFCITHQSMTDAFQAYIERLKLSGMDDRERVIEALRQ